MSDTLPAGAHQTNASGNCSVFGCPCHGWLAQETTKEVTEHKLPHSGMSGTCLRCFNDGREAERRNLHAANFDAGFATPDIEHTCQSSVEHQPAARGGGDDDERWRIDPLSSCEVIVDDPERPAYLANRIATFYGDTKEQRNQRAESAVRLHNQHQSLVAERERLETLLNNITTRAKFALSTPGFIRDRDGLQKAVDAIEQRSTSE